MSARRLLPATIVGLILLFLGFPIVVVAVVSFSSATYLTFPPPAFGLNWYAAYFGSEDWLKPTWLSIWVAACVVVLSTVLGTLASLGVARLPRPLRVVASGLILSPLIVPVIVVAIGVYYAFSRWGLVGSPLGLVLAHTCLAVPFVVTSVSASLAGIDPRLEQAALGLGATPRGTLLQVTLPLVRRHRWRAVCLHHLVRRAGRGAVPVRLGRRHPAAPHVGRPALPDRSHHRRRLDPHHRAHGAAARDGAPAAPENGKPVTEQPGHVLIAGSWLRGCNA
jgi:putative spermidine/putrescine transport system permease protein